MMLNQIQEAVDYISSRIHVKPRFGMILGSGLGGFARELSDSVTILFRDIPNFPVSTVAGHAGQMVIGIFETVPVLVLKGRFHYYEGYSMDQVTFPIRCMQHLCISNLIVTNAAGSVDKDYRPGDLMLIRDHIKFHGENPLRGPNMEAYGPRFNDMSDPYTAEIRQMVQACAEKSGIALKEGVYYYMTGPCYETASEVRAINILGAHAVGMSTAPEVIVAAHGGMKTLGISCITNMATGIIDQHVDHEKVMEMGGRVEKKFMHLMKAVLRKWDTL